MLAEIVAQEENTEKNEILYKMQMCSVVFCIPLCLNKIQKSCLGSFLYVIILNWTDAWRFSLEREVDAKETQCNIFQFTNT